MKRFADFLMWLGGWKLIGEPEPEMKNCVFIEAPHTSMWDFVWGRCGLWKLGVNAHFFIKKELFFFPLGPILKMLGGVPIDRKKGAGVVDEAVKKLRENKDFSVIITPEGTRKYTDKWKKGFYLNFTGEYGLKYVASYISLGWTMKKSKGAAVLSFTPPATMKATSKKFRSSIRIK